MLCCQQQSQAGEQDVLLHIGARVLNDRLQTILEPEQQLARQQMNLVIGPSTDRFGSGARYAASANQVERHRG